MGRPVGLGKDEIQVVVERTELPSASRLAGAVLGELLDHSGVERDGARAAMGLGRREDEPVPLDALQRLANPRPAGFEVEGRCQRSATSSPGRTPVVTARRIGSSRSVPRMAASAARTTSHAGDVRGLGP